MIINLALIQCTYSSLSYKVYDYFLMCVYFTFSVIRTAIKQRKTMIPGVMIKCLCLVLLVTAAMCFTVYKGYFRKVPIESGTSHYAEKVHPFVKAYIPKGVKMPLNTLVNIGYVIVGAAWCAYTSVGLLGSHIAINDAKMFYIFNLASCCYGPIQMIRIITQIHGFGVLDQWYTLPFFMWIFIWGLNHQLGWSSLRITILTFLSILSYFAVFYHKLGFEICLGVHIALAVTGAFIGWSTQNTAPCAKYFIRASLSCSGFVALKILDLVLPKYFLVFKYVSGHFLSKICDIFQIHYCNYYFLQIAQTAMADSKKKKD